MSRNAALVQGLWLLKRYSTFFVDIFVDNISLDKKIVYEIAFVNKLLKK
jgi:hypothetical protein